MAQVASAGAVWLGRGQCIEQYGAGEAYLPLLEALGQLGRSPDGARLVDLLRQQAPSWLRQMPALLPTTEYEELQRRSGGTTRGRMLRELAEAVETLTAARPLVLILEDLHWSDYATLDWLGLMARRRAAARLLVLGTYRPADAIARAHPVLFGMDLGVFCRSWASHALWHLGYPDQALRMSHTALARARELSHPFSLALALNYAAILHQFRREEGATCERAEAATVLCREHGFAYYLAWGTILQGWVAVGQGQGEVGIAQMRDGLAAFRVTGGKVRLPYYLALLARAYGGTGQTEAGLRLLTEALAHAETTGEGWWQPELYRLKGELRLQEGGAPVMRDAEERASRSAACSDLRRRDMLTPEERQEEAVSHSETSAAHCTKGGGYDGQNISHAVQ